MGALHELCVKTYRHLPVPAFSALPDDHATSPLLRTTTTTTRRGQSATTTTTTLTTAAAPSGPAASGSQQPAPPKAQPVHLGDSDEDSDDEDILGPNLMGQLASSLRAALQARAGTREDSPAPEAARGGGGSGSGPDAKLGLECDPAAIRWQPEVKPGAELVKGLQRVAPGVGAEKEKGLAKKVSHSVRACCCRTARRMLVMLVVAW